MENSSPVRVLTFFLLLFPCHVYGQPSPDNEFETLCGDDIPHGSWLSNIMGSRIPSSLNDNFAMVSINWKLDLSVQEGELAYRVVTRLKGEEAAIFTLENNTTSIDTITVGNLEFDTRYEALVCYANITSQILEIDSGFIPECGYCRICFRTGARAFSITSATITDVLVSSEIKSEIYECRAVPLPLEINWRARQEGSTNSIALTNSIDGIEISSYNDNDEAISVLMIRISDGNNFQTIGCRVTENGAGRVITNNFERLASINAFINITAATVTESSGSTIYECRAVGAPLPLHISWTAEDEQGNVRELSNGIIPGIEITDPGVDYERNETVSTLTININEADFSFIRCTVTNGVTEGEFRELLTTTDDTAQSDGGQTVSIPIYAIIILIVAPLVVLPILVVLSIFFYRRCYGSHKHKTNTIARAMEMPAVLSLALSMDNLDGSCVKPESDLNTVAILKAKLPEDMFISATDLNVSTIIGQGEFGVIYKAYMQAKDDQKQNIVAVKTLKGIFATSSDIEHATEEIIKMSRFDHPNVITLIGVCVAPSEQGNSSVGPSIVMPYMACGSLLDYLRKEADNLFAANEDEIPKVRKPLVQICQQVAKGMEYLAKLKFVHRDLAARNCLYV